MFGLANKTGTIGRLTPLLALVLFAFPSVSLAAPVAPFTDGFDCPLSGFDNRYVYTGEYLVYGGTQTDVAYARVNSFFPTNEYVLFDLLTGLLDVSNSNWSACDYSVVQWSDVLAPFSFGSGGGGSGTTTIFELATSTPDSVDNAFFHLAVVFFASVATGVWIFKVIA